MFKFVDRLISRYLWQLSKGDENRSSDSNRLSWFDHRVRCSIASSHLINPLLSSYNKHPTSAYSCLPQSDPTQILFLALSWFDHRVQCSAPSSHQPPPFLFSKHPISVLFLGAPFRSNSDPFSRIEPLLVQIFPTNIMCSQRRVM